MRLVVTSDTHFPFSIPGDPNPPIPEGDVLIHCGDLMYSGYPDEWYLRLGVLAAMPHKIKIIVPGNHDFHMDNYAGIARAELRSRANFLVLDEARPYVEVDGVRIFGFPNVTGLPGWAYNRTNEEIERWLSLAYTEHADIVVTHGPPYLILDAIKPDGQRTKDRNHVGSRGARRWFNSLERKPSYWFCGHIHESYGTKEVDGCSFHNVAMCDREYKQVNPPHVIEIET